MQVLINSLAWIKRSDLNQVEEYLLRNKLTFIPQKFRPNDPDPSPIRLFATSEQYIGVPRYFYFRVAKYEIFKGRSREVYQVSAGEPLRETETKFTLRPEDQEVAAQAAVRFFRESGQQVGGILRGYTAFGKSLTSLEIGRRLGRTICVLVHRKRLASQWQEACARFFPQWETGIVGDGERDWEGKDVVFCIVQSLAHPKSTPMPQEFWRYFGFLVVDEVHCFGAPFFARVTPRFHAQWCMGVSGTVRRADGMENIFKYVLGDIFFAASEKNRLKPKVWVRYTGFKGKSNLDHLQKATLLGIVSKSYDRNKLIAGDIVRAVEKGRRPLVMSERIEMMQFISRCVESIAKRKGLTLTHGWYIGGKKDEELAEAAKASVVYSTVQLAKEGIDIPELDTLFLVTPMSDPEQAIGRISRKHPDKKDPVVVDYVDDFLQRFNSSFISRLALYRKLEFTVIGLQQ